MKIAKYIFLMIFAVVLTACTSHAEAKRATKNPQIVQKQVDKPNTYKVNGRSYTTEHKNKSYHYDKRGGASYYHSKFNGRRTASGEPYSGKKYTAAHRSLPLGTHVLVTNLRNNRKVVVRINDRGPFVRGRIIDLSRAAAADIGMISSGIANVRVEKLHLAQ
ncbi:septal ring lytic transglycosylase RlpA family protein [Pasteurellaceae bacterium 22721_9_1]